jgi:hypothetical protein
MSVRQLLAPTGTRLGPDAGSARTRPQHRRAGYCGTPAALRAQARPKARDCAAGRRLDGASRPAVAGAWMGRLIFRST